MITDARITSGARLTAIYLLSRPAAWDIVASNVAAVMKVGRNKAYAMLAELADFGYIRKVREAGEGESMGRVVYEAYQTPFAWMPEEDRPSGPEAEEAPLCASGYRAPRYRDPENGDTENRAQVITELGGRERHVQLRLHHPRAGFGFRFRKGKRGRFCDPGPPHCFRWLGDKTLPAWRVNNLQRG